MPQKQGSEKRDFGQQRNGNNDEGSDPDAEGEPLWKRRRISRPTVETTTATERRTESTFDFEKLCSLIRAGKVAASATQGKDLILMFGKTGAGKTTLVYLLAGRAIVQREKMVEHDDGVRLGDTFFEQEGEPIDGFRIGQNFFSETKCVAVMPCSESWFSTNQNGTENLMLCDTPGLQDVAGPVEDIANVVNIKNAIMHARSVRPVVVLSWHTIREGRADAFREVLNNVHKFLRDINRHRKSFTVLITFPPPALEDPHGQLLNVLKKFEEDNQSGNTFTSERYELIPALMKNLSKIIKRRQKGKELKYHKRNIEFVFLPSSPELRQNLFTMICSKKPIKNPAVEFNVAIPSTSLVYLKNALSTVRMIIFRSLVTGEDFKTGFAMLGAFETLQNEVPEVLECMRLISREIRDKFHTKETELKKQFDIAMQDYHDFDPEEFVQGWVTLDDLRNKITRHCLPESTVHEENTAHQLLSANGEESTEAGSETHSSDSKLITHRNRNQEYVLGLAKSYLLNPISKQLQVPNRLDFILLKTRVQKTQSLSKISHFINTPELGDIYSQVQGFLVRYFNSVLEEIEKVLNQSLIHLLAGLIDVLDKAGKMGFQEFLPSDVLLEEMKLRSLRVIDEKLKQIVKAAQNLLRTARGIPRPKLVTKIRGYWEILESAFHEKSLQEYLQLVAMNGDDFAVLLRTFRETFDSYTQRITQEKKSLKPYQSTSELLDGLWLLLEVDPQRRNQIFDFITKTINIIVEGTVQASRSVKEVVRQLNSGFVRVVNKKEADKKKADIQSILFKALRKLRKLSVFDRHTKTEGAESAQMLYVKHLETLSNLMFSLNGLAEQTLLEIDLPMWQKGNSYLEGIHIIYQTFEQLRSSESTTIKMDDTYKTKQDILLDNIKKRFEQQLSGLCGSWLQVCNGQHSLNKISRTAEWEHVEKCLEILEPFWNNTLVKLELVKFRNILKAIFWKAAQQWEAQFKELFGEDDEFKIQWDKLDKHFMEIERIARYSRVSVLFGKMENLEMLRQEKAVNFVTHMDKLLKYPTDNDEAEFSNLLVSFREMLKTRALGTLERKTQGQTLLETFYHQVRVQVENFTPTLESHAYDRIKIFFEQHSIERMHQQFRELLVHLEIIEDKANDNINDLFEHRRFQAPEKIRIYEQQVELELKPIFHHLERAQVLDEIIRTGCRELRMKRRSEDNPFQIIQKNLQNKLIELSASLKSCVGKLRYREARSLYLQLKALRKKIGTARMTDIQQSLDGHIETYEKALTGESWREKFPDLMQWKPTDPPCWNFDVLRELTENISDGLEENYYHNAETVRLFVQNHLQELTSSAKAALGNDNFREAYCICWKVQWVISESDKRNLELIRDRAFLEELLNQINQEREIWKRTFQFRFETNIDIKNFEEFITDERFLEDDKKLWITEFCAHYESRKKIFRRCSEMQNEPKLLSIIAWFENLLEHKILFKRGIVPVTFEKLKKKISKVKLQFDSWLGKISAILQKQIEEFRLDPTRMLLKELQEIAPHILAFEKSINSEIRKLLEQLKQQFRERHELLHKAITEERQKWQTCNPESARPMLEKIRGLENFLSILSKLPHSEKLINTITSDSPPVEQIQQDLRRIIDEVFPNKCAKELQEQRFEDLGQRVKFLQDYNQVFAPGVPVKVASFLHNLPAEIQKIQDLAFSSWNRADMAEFQKQMHLLDQVECHLRVDAQVNRIVTDAIKEVIHHIGNKLKQEKQMVMKKLDEGIGVLDIVGMVVKLRSYADDVPKIGSAVNSAIEDIFDFHLNHSGARIIYNIGRELKNSRSKHAAQVLQEFPSCFSAIHAQNFNERATRLSPDALLNSFFGTDLKCLRDDEKQCLKAAYESFEGGYKSLLKEFLYELQPGRSHAENRSILQNSINTLGTKTLCIASMVPKVSQSQLAARLLGQSYDSLVSLVAHLFALWTLSGSTSALQYLTVREENALLTPHPIQVLTIFRLLCLDQVPAKWSFFQSQQNPLNNHLVEIGTGEGKSVTLGVMSLVLALMGYNVYCVCYSQYLSDRDRKAFTDLFAQLKVLDKINYSTIDQLCEKLINEQGDLRELTDRFLTQRPITSPTIAPITQQNRILLIDEVDVFFNDSFYGNTFNPSLKLRCGAVGPVFAYLWRNRTNPTGIQNVGQTEEYRNLMKEFPTFGKLIEFSVKQMIHGLQYVSNPPYEVDMDGDRIGYKRYDAISYSVNEGYRTVFAYMLENENRKISEQAVKREQCLLFVCGLFSFANMPAKFCKILGVTGTLKSLSASEKEIVEKEFNIRKRTFTPSVYGENNCRWSPNADIYVEKDEDHWMRRIREQIDVALETRQVSSEKSQRAVLVFFDSVDKIKAFSAKKYGKGFNKCNLITETTLNIEHYVSKATDEGQVTLLTRIFGRGLDFVVHDPKVVQAGGVMVIQTFLSESYSEEVQIRGRTARQGQHGNYQLILLQSDLEKMNISAADIQTHSDRKSLYTELLHPKRQEYECNKAKEKRRTIKVSQDVHTLSENYKNALIQNDRDKALQLLLKLQSGNQGTVVTKLFHTFLVIDVSGSMSSSDSKPSKDSFQWQPNRLGAVLQAMNQYIEQRKLANEADLVSVIPFNDRVLPCIEAKKLLEMNWPADTKHLSPSGGTDFDAPLKMVQQILEKCPPIHHTPFVFFLSDGEGSCGEGYKVIQSLKEKYSHFRLDTLIFGADKSGERTLKELARIGGGSFLTAMTGDELERVCTTMTLNFK